MSDQRRTQTNPNSLANLEKRVLFGKGQPPPAPRPRGLIGHLRAVMGEEVQTADGRKVSRDRAVAELLVRRAIWHLGFDPETGEPRPWCKSIELVINKLIPAQREYKVEDLRTVPPSPFVQLCEQAAERGGGILTREIILQQLALMADGDGGNGRNGRKSRGDHADSTPPGNGDGLGEPPG